MTFSKNSMNQNSHQKIIFVTLDVFRKDNVDFCPTLKAFVREQIEMGKELPLDLLGVHIGQRSEIRRPQ